MNYTLEGYSKEEGREYIDLKLKGAGCHQTVFDEGAIEAILNGADCDQAARERRDAHIRLRQQRKPDNPAH